MVMLVHAKDDAYLDAVIPKRIQLFESIQAQKHAARQSLPSDPIKPRCRPGAMLDYQLPERFELCYSSEEGKMERPVMIHRAILGSVERMVAVLLEDYKGKWPLWLSPRQAIVCPVSQISMRYAEEVREAQMAQYNYILVVGGEDVKNGHVGS
ncbi:hypothetical protein GBA52_022302 [Prunus armeniaca]|nr:hypothetical protein GBA52_022302 [Prunus armeniaca]